jgi:hypothetical protein
MFVEVHDSCEIRNPCVIPLEHGQGLSAIMCRLVDTIPTRMDFDDCMCGYLLRQVQAMITRQELVFERYRSIFDYLKRTIHYKTEQSQHFPELLLVPVLRNRF